MASHTDRNRRHSERGARGVAVIELAFLLVFLLLLMIGLTELGRAFWYYDALQKAVRDGARCLSIVPNLTPTSSSATDMCLDQLVSDANSAGVVNAFGGASQPLKNPDNVAYVLTNIPASLPPKPEYVTVYIRNYDMGFIWSLGAPLPEPGGTTPIVAQATMPYMK